MLLAHLSVQAVEGQRNADKVINYETLFRKGFLPDLLPGRETGDRDVNKLDAPETKGRYIRYGTKNPTNPYSWVLRYAKEDWQTTEYILGKHMATAFPDDVSDEDAENDAYMPNFAFKDTSPDTNHEMLGNRLVTAHEFAEFINACIDFGISDIFRRLCIRESSQHSVRIDESGRCVAKEPRLPITLVSPLAALAYARYHRAMLPTPDAYRRLHENTKHLELNKENANFGENIGKPSRVGLFVPLLEFYDLYGNVREMIHSEREGTVYFVGGSYKDEPEQLRLDNVVSTTFMIHDTHTGFRLMRNKRTFIERNNVLKKIAETKCPKELFDYLSSMRLTSPASSTCICNDSFSKEPQST